MADFSVKFQSSPGFAGGVKFQNSPDFSACFGEVHRVSDGGYEKGYEAGYQAGFEEANNSNAYEGTYEITPTSEVQVLPTKHKLLNQNIVINPIPERYGLVTYDQNRTITIT